MPFEWIVETIQLFYKLEKDLVPLLEIPRKRALEIDSFNELIEQAT